MAIHFVCECGKTLQADEAMAGLHVKCGDCGATLLVPSLGGGPARERPSEFAATPLPTEGRREPGDWGDEEQTRYAQAPAAGGTSGKAVSGFILSLLSFFCPIFLSILALILAILGLADVNRSRGRAEPVKGKGLAITGIVLSCITMTVWPFVVGIGLLVPAVQKVREAAARAQTLNNLKEIGLAAHNYHDANRQFPPHAIYSQDGRPLLSWRVAILPYLGHQNLYASFKLDEPWDGPNNIRLLKSMPLVFRSPLMEDVPDSTHLQAFVGRGTMFEPRVKIKIQEIADGASNTILFVEAGKAVPWTKPEDLPFDPNLPLPKLGGNGFAVVIADGSVRYFRHGELSEATLRAMITRNGGERIKFDR